MNHVLQLIGGDAPSHARRRRQPSRQTPTSTFCYPVQATVLLDLLRYAQRAKDRDAEPFSFEAAAVSYMLDEEQVVRGRSSQPSVRDYARLWGWSKTRVERTIPELQAQIADWRSAFGRLRSGDANDDGPPDSAVNFTGFRGTPVGQRWDTFGTKNEESEAESAKCGTRLGQQWDSCGTHTIQLYNALTLQEENTHTNTRGRARGSEEENRRETAGTNDRQPPTSPPDADSQPYDPQTSPPTLDDVLAAAAVDGVAPDTATKFFELYASQGWVTASGTPLRNWRLRLGLFNRGEQAAGGGFRPRAVSAESVIRGGRPTAADDAWWMMDFERAQARAARQGVSDWQVVWRSYRDAGGKLYFVDPENFTRPVPDGFTPFEVPA